MAGASAPLHTRARSRRSPGLSDAEQRKGSPGGEAARGRERRGMTHGRPTVAAGSPMIVPAHCAVRSRISCDYVQGPARSARGERISGISEALARLVHHSPKPERTAPKEECAQRDLTGAHPGLPHGRRLRPQAVGLHPGPVAAKPSQNLPAMTSASLSQEAPSRCSTSGQGGIRTHETREGPPVFKTGAINHSTTCPGDRAATARRARHRKDRQFAPSMLGRLPSVARGR